MTAWFSIYAVHAAGVIEDAVPLSKVLTNTLNFLLSVAGVLGIIGLVVAGLLYLTAAGDEHRIELAKRATYFSVIGLVIVLGALVIVTTLTQIIS